MAKKSLKSLFDSSPDPDAEKNAAAWNAPGGGYDQWKQGDPEREKELPPGGIVKMQPDPDIKPVDVNKFKPLKSKLRKSKSAIYGYAD